MKEEFQFQSKQDQLADTLKKSGFAFSAYQAKAMAQAIASTETRVQDHFETKKASSLANHIIAGSQSGKNFFEENKAKLIQNALNPQPIKVQAYYDTPEISHKPQEKNSREREITIDLVKNFKQREEGERYYKQFGSSPKQHDGLHAEPEKQSQQLITPQIASHFEAPIVEQKIEAIQEQVAIQEPIQQQAPQVSEFVIEPKIEVEVKTPEIMSEVKADEKKEFILEVYEADKKENQTPRVEIVELESKPKDRIETIPPVHTTSVEAPKVNLEVYHEQPQHSQPQQTTVAVAQHQALAQSVSAENFFNFAKKEAEAKKHASVSLPNMPPMASRMTDIPRAVAPQAQHVEKLPNVDVSAYFNFGNKSAQGNNGLKLAQPKTSPAPAPRPAMPSVDLGAYFNYNKNKGR